jgi:hypothetical protein
MLTGSTKQLVPLKPQSTSNSTVAALPSGDTNSTDTTSASLRLGN